MSKDLPRKYRLSETVGPLRLSGARGQSEWRYLAQPFKMSGKPSQRIRLPHLQNEDVPHLEHQVWKEESVVFVPFFSVLLRTVILREFFPVFCLLSSSVALLGLFNLPAKRYNLKEPGVVYPDCVAKNWAWATHAILGFVSFGRASGICSRIRCCSPNCVLEWRSHFARLPGGGAEWDFFGGRKRWLGVCRGVGIVTRRM